MKSEKRNLRGKIEISKLKMECKTVLPYINAKTP